MKISAIVAICLEYLLPASMIFLPFPFDRCRERWQPCGPADLQRNRCHTEIAGVNPTSILNYNNNADAFDGILRRDMKANASKSTSEKKTVLKATRKPSAPAEEKTAGQKRKPEQALSANCNTAQADVIDLTIDLTSPPRASDGMVTDQTSVPLPSTQQISKRKAGAETSQKAVVAPVLASTPELAGVVVVQTGKRQTTVLSNQADECVTLGVFPHGGPMQNHVNDALTRIAICHITNATAHVDIHDLATGKLVKSFSGFSTGTCVALDPTGSKVVTVDPESRQVSLKDVERGSKVWSMKYRLGVDVPVLRFSRDGKYVFVNCGPEIIQLDASTGKRKAGMSGLKTELLALSPYQPWLAFVEKHSIGHFMDPELEIRIINYETGRDIGHVDCYEDCCCFEHVPFTAIAFGADDTIVTLNEENLIASWNLHTSKKLWSISLDSNTYNIFFNHSNNTVIVVVENGFTIIDSGKIVANVPLKHYMLSAYITAPEVILL